MAFREIPGNTPAAQQIAKTFCLDQERDLFFEDKARNIIACVKSPHVMEIAEGSCARSIYLQFPAITKDNRCTFRTEFVDSHFMDGRQILEDASYLYVWKLRYAETGKNVPREDAIQALKKVITLYSSQKKNHKCRVECRFDADALQDAAASPHGKKAPKQNEPRIAVTAGTLIALVFFVAALVGIAERIAGSQGGGIEAEVRGNGIARQVACTRDGASLGTGWTCRAEDITWENRGKLPDRVLPQKVPYTVLATGDLSGREFPVTSHLPMGWQTAGSLRSPQPGEILLAPDHPVGAYGWWTAQVFLPPLVIALLITLIAVILIRRDK